MSNMTHDQRGLAQDEIDMETPLYKYALRIGFITALIVGIPLAIVFAIRSWPWF